MITNLSKKKISKYFLSDMTILAGLLEGRKEEHLLGKYLVETVGYMEKITKEAENLFELKINKKEALEFLEKRIAQRQNINILVAYQVIEFLYPEKSPYHFASFSEFLREAGFYTELEEVKLGIYSSFLKTNFQILSISVEKLKKYFNSLEISGKAYYSGYGKVISIDKVNKREILLTSIRTRKLDFYVFTPIL